MRLTNAKKSTGALGLLTAGVLAGGLFVSGGAASAAAGPGLPNPLPQGTKTHTKLVELNNSDVRGASTVTVKGPHRINVRVNARGLLRNMPHAMHIHFDMHSRHTCPTVRDDKNGDHRLSTTEGHSSYGMIKTSLTKRGDTSPASGLAVNRFPTAPHGKIHYQRTIHTTSTVTRAVRSGKAAVVIHGIDYNQNRTYDFGGAGKSDLDPKLPAEATDPVACGVLHKQKSALPLP